MSMNLAKDELGSILATHPDVICRYDLDLNFTYANSAAARFFGQERNALLKMNQIDLSPPEDHDSVRAYFAGITPAKPEITVIHTLERPDGPVSLLWTSIGLFEDGKLVGYQSVGRDITVETDLRDRLSQRTHDLEIVQNELRAVLDAVPATIWYKDDKNNILRLNKAAADSIGMTVEEVEGRNTYDLFGPSAKKYHDDDLKVFNSGKPMLGIVEPFTPDSGRQGWVQTDKLLIETSDGDMRLLAVATDITELKEKEAILTSINKNLDDFASMVSHDLQAPLRKIAITAELMQLEVGDALPESSAPYFEDIAAGVERMRALIRNFLRFMRETPESVSLGAIDLRAVLDRVADDQSDALDAANGSLQLPDGPLHVYGDAVLLGQVFTNLIGNAVKYRHPDRPPAIDIRAQTGQQQFVIHVEDNGCGIDPDHWDSIFNLFDRAKPHGTVDGSGVGLALCNRIIALHGGEIKLFKSGPDGSCFEITLFRSGAPDDG